MQNTIPSIEEIKDIHFWVPPQPSSLMLTVIPQQA